MTRTIRDYKEDGDLVLEFQSNARDILASEREIVLMRTELQKRQEHHASLIPYLTIVDFAIDSCMRISEICRVEWRDFNIEDRTLKIRERKHPKPGRQKHNNQTIPLIGNAFDILHARKIELENKLSKLGQGLNYQSKIFPYNPRSVSAGWQRCRESLISNGENIENIRFHDLRAYGASRLINEGWDLSEISIVTGHKDINILNNIYMRNKPKDMALKDLIRKKNKQ